MPERVSLNQQAQFGVETTPGTSVAANKLLRCFSVETGIEVDSKFFRATGRKYPAIQELNKEWSGGSIEGEMDFNGLIYPLSGVMGSTSPVAHGASSTAKDWIFTPPIAGNTTLKTYTIEQGDAVRAHKLVYGLFNQWGYKGTRDDFTTSGEFIGQLITDGTSMTSSPTAIAVAPMVAKNFNVYLDSTSGGLGGTQLTRVKSVEFDMSDVYDAAWFINRSVSSWTTHIDTEPKCTFKMTLEADATGMGLLTHLRSGDTRYIRVAAIGNEIATDGPGSITHEFIHDMALKFSKVSPWKDEDGIYAIEFEATVVEDTAWGSGTAQKVTLTNLLTAL